MRETIISMQFSEFTSLLQGMKVIELYSPQKTPYRVIRCRKSTCWIRILRLSVIFCVLLTRLRSDAIPSLCLRFKSVTNPFQVPSLEWEKNGICMGFGRDLQGRCIGTTMLIFGGKAPFLDIALSEFIQPHDIQ